MLVEEMRFNIVSGENSTEKNDIVVKIIFDDKTYCISGTFYDYYQREKVDGRYTSNLPTNTKIFKTIVDAIPPNIEEIFFSDVLFEIKEKLYSVRFVSVASEVVVFTLQPYEGVENE